MPKCSVHKSRTLLIQTHWDLGVRLAYELAYYALEQSSKILPIMPQIMPAQACLGVFKYVTYKLRLLMPSHLYAKIL